MEFAFCGKDAEQLNDAVRFAMVYMEDLLHIQLYKQAGWESWIF